MVNDEKKTSQEFKLEPDSELRFEVESKGEKVILTLKAGFAEVFGTELVKGKSYDFSAGAKIAVYTWKGCTLDVKGKTDVIYVAPETPMVFYCNCHGALEDMRLKADKNQERGPITMIVGPCDVGKSTLSRILLNYAVRMGKRPLFVDLDVGQGQISIPGTIGALLIERPASLDDGFSQEAPMVYHFGHKSPGENITLYNLLTQELANSVKERLETNKKVKMSGVIINTCGWIKGDGYRNLIKAVKAFEVNVILVLDSERLYNELVRDVPRDVKVVFTPKSGGVVERSQSVRSEARDQRIREYFYGTLKNSLYPHPFDVKWSDVKIVKIGAPALPDSCLPLGMKAEDHLTKVVPLTPNNGMLHHLFAVSFAKDDENILLSNIAGFVCITNMDIERQTMTLLAPQPRPLPNAVLIFSEIQFMDNH